MEHFCRCLLISVILKSTPTSSIYQLTPNKSFSSAPQGSPCEERGTIYSNTELWFLPEEENFAQISIQFHSGEEY